VNNRLPITAIVASHNEAVLLRRCLPTIRFCDELIVVDLCSTDDTAGVAESNGAQVIRHSVERTVERVRNSVLPRARHDWVLTTDPDEELPAALQSALIELFPSIPLDVAIVSVPIRYYFRRRPLVGTTWGGERYRRLLVRRSAVDLTSTIYSGMLMRDGYRELELEYSPVTAIVHNWSPGYRALLSKHRRYLSATATDRHRAGEVTGWRELLSTPGRSFFESFFVQRGYRDGLTGFALSLFWAGFRTAGEAALLRRLRQARRP